MRTYSQMPEQATEALAVSRVLVNDLLDTSVRNYRAEQLAAKPEHLAFEYLVPAACNDYTRDRWLAWAPLNGYTAENGFIHQGAFDEAGRVDLRTVPAPGVPYASTYPWFMNQADAGWRAFLADNAVRLLNRTWYEGDTAYPDGYVCDGIHYDLGYYYPEFDTDRRIILDSIEFNEAGGTLGDPDDYEYATAECYVTVLDACRAAYPTARNLITFNFGSPTFCIGAYASRAGTMLIHLRAPSIMVEETFLYTGGKTAAKATAMLAVMDFIQAWAETRPIQSHVRINYPYPQSSADIARAGIGAAAIMMLMYGRYLYGCFKLGVEWDAQMAGVAPNTQQPNGVLKRAHALLGDPTGEREEVTGHGGTQGRLFKRSFQRGIALYYVQKDGFSGSDTATYTVTGSYGRMVADGSVTASVESVALTVGEGAILAESPVSDRLIGTSDSAPIQFIPTGGSGGHVDRVNESKDAPSTTELLSTSSYGQVETHLVERFRPDGTDNIPQDILLCTRIVAWIHRRMMNGVPASPTGFMWIPFRLLTGGQQVKQDVIALLGNDPWTTVALSFTLALDQNQMNALAYQFDTTTSGGAAEWLGTPTRFQVATVNLDIEYVSGLTGEAVRVRGIAGASLVAAGV